MPKLDIIVLKKENMMMHRLLQRCREGSIMFEQEKKKIRRKAPDSRRGQLQNIICSVLLRVTDERL